PTARLTGVPRVQGGKVGGVPPLPLQAAAAVPRSDDNLSTHHVFPTMDLLRDLTRSHQRLAEANRPGHLVDTHTGNDESFEGDTPPRERPPHQVSKPQDNAGLR